MKLAVLVKNNQVSDPLEADKLVIIGEKGIENTKTLPPDQKGLSKLLTAALWAKQQKTKTITLKRIGPEGYKTLKELEINIIIYKGTIHQLQKHLKKKTKLKLATQKEIDPNCPCCKPPA